MGPYLLSFALNLMLNQYVFVHNEYFHFQHFSSTEIGLVTLLTHSLASQTSFLFLLRSSSSIVIHCTSQSFHVFLVMLSDLSDVNYVFAENGLVAFKNGEEIAKQVLLLSSYLATDFFIYQHSNV